MCESNRTQNHRKNRHKTFTHNTIKHMRVMNVPLMVALLGSMVTAPTAASSSWLIGLFLAPQLSEPIHRKWPTCSARLLAFRIPLESHRYHHWVTSTDTVCVGVRSRSSGSGPALLTRTECVWTWYFLVYIKVTLQYNNKQFGTSSH